MKNIILLIITSLYILTTTAQTSIKDNNYIDTSTTMVWTHANFSYQIPFGQGYLGQTFGNNFNIGTGIIIKSISNWTYEANFNYMFGSDVVLPDSAILGSMVNSNGDIFDENGLKATIYLEGRYWSFGGGVGKIIPINRWKNSGIWIKANVGYMGHKIHITDPENGVPQLDKDTYRKGYDQRSSGYMMSQFFGYTYMKKKRVTSFYAGIEITEMWTKPNRSYSFLLGSSSSLPFKFSGQVGLKLGWIIPLYEKQKVIKFYKY
jgi:hypothetical protein